MLTSELLQVILAKLVLFLIFNVPLFSTVIALDFPSKVNVRLSISTRPPLLQTNP